MASEEASLGIVPSRPALWRDPRVRGIAYQLAFVAAVLGLGAFLVHNTLVNIGRQNIATGFGFLHREAAFGIGESLIDYSPADTYARAFLVGLTNTLHVAALGIVLATILGTLMGLARLSSNWLVRKLSQVYVETFRNIPLALQLFFWWGLLNKMAPGPRQAWEILPDVFVCNRGIVYPVPVASAAYKWVGLAFVVGIALSFVAKNWARRRQAVTGRQLPSGWIALGLVVGLPAATFLLAGAPFALDVPALKGFNFSGGDTMSPEFAALLVELVVYTGTFISEIVRAGILAVSWGQSEAAMALGLRPSHRMRLVVLPQALRVIIPPITSQYLNLTKNSSLAVMIGFPDLVSIANTTINQTGQAIEGIALIMAVYLFISLAISLAMNLHNRAVALVERWGMADVTQDIPVAAQAPPPRSNGVLGWLRANLFNGVANTVLTVLCVALLAVAIPPLVRWGLINAIWSAPNGAACHGAGACWAFIGEKVRFILFGFFPAGETWRPAAVVVVFVSMILVACDRRSWGRRLAYLWVGGLCLVFALMRGGALGLSYVETSLWSGLPLTLILAVVGMLLGFPLGIMLALGRRSQMTGFYVPIPISLDMKLHWLHIQPIRMICVAYIELVRGVPLITVLFMASLMLPLFLPAGMTIDKLVRAQVAFILFAGAYLAEVVRGGLQAIPKGQSEAADALGLSYWQRTRLIVLPQALAMVIPPLVNTFIGMFKDTSLVIIISLFDLLTCAETALSDVNWQGFYVETYIFVGMIYWAFCFFMSRYSQVLEREFNRGKRR